MKTVPRLKWANISIQWIFSVSAIFFYWITTKTKISNILLLFRSRQPSSSVWVQLNVTLIRSAVVHEWQCRTFKNTLFSEWLKGCRAKLRDLARRLDMMEEIISTYYYNNGPCMEETGRFGWYIKEEPKFKEDLGKTA